jgi:hypothetical protein
MDRSSFIVAMFATHLPYMVIAAALIVVARRMRRTVNRLVDELESKVRSRQ